MSVELGFCELFLRDDDVMQINIPKHTEIGMQETILTAQTCMKLTNNTPKKGIVFLSEFVTFSKESREYAASKEGFKPFTKLAYVLDNPGQAIIANFYLKVNKPVKPVKFFYSERNALEWLHKS